MGTEALLRCRTAPEAPGTREDLAYPCPAAPGDTYGKRTGNDSYSKNIKFYITFLHKSIIIMIIILLYMVDIKGSYWYIMLKIKLCSTPQKDIDS